MAIGQAIKNGSMLGLMTTGVLTGGTVGATIGMTEKEHPIGKSISNGITGGIIGGVSVGLMGAPFAGAEATLKAGKEIGKVGAKVGVSALSGIGETAIGVTEGLGKSFMKAFNKTPLGVIGAVATGAAVGGILGDMDPNVDMKDAAIKGGTLALGASVIPGAASVIAGAGAMGVGAVMTGVNAVGAVGKSMVTKTAEGGYKLSATATPLLLGAMAVKGIGEGIKTFEKSRMGTNDGTFVGPAPNLPTTNNSPSYANNAGATGDLVFSLFNNR